MKKYLFMPIIWLFVVFFNLGCDVNSANVIEEQTEDLRTSTSVKVFNIDPLSYYGEDMDYMEIIDSLKIGRLGEIKKITALEVLKEQANLQISSGNGNNELYSLLTDIEYELYILEKNIEILSSEIDKLSKKIVMETLGLNETEMYLQFPFVANIGELFLLMSPVYGLVKYDTYYDSLELIDAKFNNSSLINTVSKNLLMKNGEEILLFKYDDTLFAYDEQERLVEYGKIEDILIFNNMGTAVYVSDNGELNMIDNNLLNSIFLMYVDIENHSYYFQENYANGSLFVNNDGDLFNISNTGVVTSE